MDTTQAFFKSSHQPKTGTPRKGVSQQNVQISKTRLVASSANGEIIVYGKQHGSGRVEKFAVQLLQASPMQLVNTEKNGINSIILKDMAVKMRLPIVKIFSMVGVPKATAEKKVATGAALAGSGGQAAIGLAKLIGIAKTMAENSTAAAAQGFDSAAWLGRWLEVPQPSLGGRKPSDLIDTPTGLDMVTRLLGSIESGAYQ